MVAQAYVSAEGNWAVRLDTAGRHERRWASRRDSIPETCLVRRGKRAALSTKDERKGTWTTWETFFRFGCVLGRIPGVRPRASTQRPGLSPQIDSGAGNTMYIAGSGEGHGLGWFQTPESRHVKKVAARLVHGAPGMDATRWRGRRRFQVYCVLKLVVVPAR